MIECGHERTAAVVLHSRAVVPKQLFLVLWRLLTADSIALTIRQALHRLEAERKQVDAQIETLQRVLTLMDGRKAKPAATPAATKPAPRKRGGMSAKARQAVRERMKAYWAKRRAAKGQKSAAK